MPPSSPPFTAGAAPGRLAGQVIIVVGGDQRLLRPLARVLAYLGAQVVIARASDSGADTAGLILAEGGLARFLRTDPDEEASLARLAEQTTAAFGPIDCVINAGDTVPSVPILKVTATDWERLVTHPLRRALAISQAFLPAMLTRGQGTLVNMGYDVPLPQHAAANAAQHGIVGFSQALAAEVRAQGVRVLAVAAAPEAAPEHIAGATAYVLTRSAHEQRDGLVQVETVLAAVSLSQPAPGAEMAVAPAPTRAATLAQALSLSQLLATLLMDTDSDFDRLPTAVRPMARGAFLSQVGYRSQEVLRAVHKLGDQLQRMQASHSGTDTEFQVDFPRLGELFERLLAYYQALPDETSRLLANPALAAQLRRQMSERAALIHSLLATLRQIHGT